MVVFFPFNEFINLQLRPLIEIHGITTDIAIKKQTEGNAANSELSHPKLKVSLVRMSRSLAGVKQEYNVFIRNPSDTDVSIVAIEYGVRFNTNYLMVYESYNIGNESGPVQLSVLIPLEFQCDKAYAEWQRRRFDLEQPLELKKNALRGVKFRFLSKETCTHEISDGTFDLYAIDEDGRRLKILDSDDVAYPSGPPDNLPTR